MAMERFVKALQNKKPKYKGGYRYDEIPGTDKIRTYAGARPDLFSEESELKTIMANEQRAFVSKRNSNK